MKDPRIVDVAFVRGQWLAEVAPDFDEQIETDSFQGLVDRVQRDWPDEALIFIVDYSTIEGIEDAEAEVLKIGETSGARVASSQVPRSLRGRI